MSAELNEQLLKEAVPEAQLQSSVADIELSAPTGAYSTDYRAIFLTAGIANRTNEPDQVVTWKLSFPKLNIELDPTPAPSNLFGGTPWFPSLLVKLPPNELVRGSLYFRGIGVLAEGLPEEPMHGKVTATTLHGKTLSQDVKVYWMATLQARAKAASV